MEQRLSHSEVSLEQYVFENGGKKFTDLISSDQSIKEDIAEKNEKEMIRHKVVGC